MIHPVHLVLFIVNLLIPLIWIPLIIRHVKGYYDLKAYYAERDTKIRYLRSTLPLIDENTPAEIREQTIAANANAEFMLTDHECNLKHAFYMMVFWAAVGIVMSISATVQSIDVVLKIYHKECPCLLITIKEKQSSTNADPQKVSPIEKGDQK